MRNPRSDEWVPLYERGAGQAVGFHFSPQVREIGSQLFGRLDRTLRTGAGGATGTARGATAGTGAAIGFAARRFFGIGRIAEGRRLGEVEQAKGRIESIGKFREQRRG